MHKNTAIVLGTYLLKKNKHKMFAGVYKVALVKKEKLILLAKNPLFTYKLCSYLTKINRYS